MAATGRESPRTRRPTKRRLREPPERILKGYPGTQDPAASPPATAPTSIDVSVPFADLGHSMIIFRRGEALPRDLRVYPLAPFGMHGSTG